MKWLLIVGAILLILGSSGAAYASESISDTGLKSIVFSNATYPDGNSVGNMTMIYDPVISKYVVLWDEMENYTYGGSEVKSREIMISLSSDFVNWTGSRRDVVISYEDGTNSSSPDLAYDPGSGKLHAVWSELNKSSGYREIYYGYSDDGVNWSSIRSNWVISNLYKSGVGDCIEPKIAVSSDEFIHAVWIGYNLTYGSWEVYYGNSYNGSSWNSEQRDTPISPVDSSSVQSVDIAVENIVPLSRVWVFWTEYEVSDSAYAVYAANSTYPYGSWNVSMVSSTYGLNAYNVSAMVNGTDVYVFWEQEVIENNVTVREIAAKHLVNGQWANTQGGSLTISYPDGHNATHPSASESSWGVFVTWDEFDENTGYRQIMYGNTTRDNWTSAKGDMLLTKYNYDSKMPTAYVSDSGMIYVAWMHWIEVQPTKQHGAWEGCTLRASTGDLIPELWSPVVIISAMVAVLAYATWKRKRA